MTELFRGEVDARMFPRGAAEAFAFDKFKGAVTLRRTTPQIGVQPSRIIPNNPDRVSYLVSNTSASEIHVGWDEEITTSLGFLIPPNGGWFRAEVDKDGGVIGWALFGVAPAAAQQLYVIEIIRYRVRRD